MTLIRDFKETDVEGIIRIHSVCNESFEFPSLSTQFIINISKRNDFKLLIAEMEGKVIGFAGTLFYESVGRAELGPIAVDPDYKGRGVGTKLVDDVLMFLNQVSMHRVIVRIKSGNMEGIEFFKRRGFRREVLFRRYTRDREDVVQMVKFLKIKTKKDK